MYCIFDTFWALIYHVMCINVFVIVCKWAQVLNPIITTGHQCWSVKFMFMNGHRGPWHPNHRRKALASCQLNDLHRQLRLHSLHSYWWLDTEQREAPHHIKVKPQDVFRSGLDSFLGKGHRFKSPGRLHDLCSKTSFCSVWLINVIHNGNFIFRCSL